MDPVECYENSMDLIKRSVTLVQINSRRGRGSPGEYLQLRGATQLSEPLSLAFF